MTSTKYRMKRDSKINSFAKAGTIVYPQRGPDYGLASADTRAFGYECMTVTLNADGSYPGFVVPVHDLEKIVEAPVDEVPIVGFGGYHG